MQNFNNPAKMAPGQRIREIARILAKGYMTMKKKQRHILSTPANTKEFSVKAQKPLDLSGHQSVHAATS